MNRTLLLLLIFLILAGTLGYYLYTREEDPSTLIGKDREFAVEDTDQIYKIFLVHRDGETVLLERQKKDEWQYNGQYRARPNAVENLLDAVRRVQVLYKPGQAAVAPMITDLGSRGIKVELYDKEEKLIKTYYVGGSTTDERGTFMIMEGFDDPYVTHIPSWQGNLRFRYNLKGEDWRDRSVFAVQPDQIAEVTVEYPRQKNRSFRLSRNGNTFVVVPFYSITPSINGTFLKEQAETFLDGFRSLGAEAFANDNLARDSVMQLTPFAEIRVQTTDGKGRYLRLFPIYPPQLGIDPKSNAILTYNRPVERYFADVNGEDFMLVQNIVFRKILWGYDFFFQN